MLNFYSQFEREVKKKFFFCSSFQVALVVKNWPAKGDVESWVRSLGQEDPLEEDMAAHSRILA